MLQAFTKYNQSSKFLTVHKRDDDYKKAPTAAAHVINGISGENQVNFIYAYKHIYKLEEL